MVEEPDPFNVAACAERIRQALRDEGFDPRMLDYMAPAYVIAALLLKVK